MALVLARITSAPDDNQLALERVDALYVDGYSFGDRQLEEIYFKITPSTSEPGIQAEMLLEESLRKKLFINRAEVEAQAVEEALGTDILSCAPKYDAPDGVILRTHLPADQQMFGCPSSFLLDGQEVILPKQE